MKILVDEISHHKQLMSSGLLEAEEVHMVLNAIKCRHVELRLRRLINFLNEQSSDSEVQKFRIWDL